MPHEHPILYWMIENLSPWFIVYFALINACYTFFLFIGSIRIFYRKYTLGLEKLPRNLTDQPLGSMTFIIPSYNEQHHLMAKIENTLAVPLVHQEILIVDDGSTDDTLAELIRELELIEIPMTHEILIPCMPIKAVYQSARIPCCKVIAKVHGKKHDALNAGLNFARHPYVITTDVDTMIDGQTFSDLIRPFFSDPRIVALGASVRIKNGIEFHQGQIGQIKLSRSWLAGLQLIEYLRCFFIRIGIDSLNAGFVVSGCFTIFPLSRLIECKGFAPTVAEDMEIIIRLHREMRKKKQPFKVCYMPDPAIYTEVPETLSRLGRQRRQWHRGLMESFAMHPKMFFNPFYGLAGLAAYPFGFFFEILEPLIELAGFITILSGYLMGYLDLEYFLILISFSYGFTFFISISCLFIEELSFDRYPRRLTTGKMIALCALENLGYRQLNLIWRLQGMISFLTGLWVRR